MQDMLYAQDRWSLLLIFQAMDCAGKDGTQSTRHVRALNPQAARYLLQVANEHGSDQTTSGAASRLPERGANRNFQSQLLRGNDASYGHPEISRRTENPRSAHGKTLRTDRFQDIAVERYLQSKWNDRCNFFFTSRRKQQEKRSSGGSNTPDKNLEVLRNRHQGGAFWRITDAYEEMIRGKPRRIRCGMFFFVPAENKWFTRVILLGDVEGTRLSTAHPKLSAAKRQGARCGRMETLLGSK